MTDVPTRPDLDAAVLALFQASALMDPMRLRIWDAEGLTVTQLRLLAWVAEEEGMSNADLADRLYVTRPSVSALLDRLERGGFVRREISAVDRRGITIWLEERGRRAVTSHRQENRASVAGLMESLSDDDLKEIWTALGKLVVAGQERRRRDLAADRAEG